MTTQPLAQAFPVGDYLAEELEERGWTVDDFASILDVPSAFAAELITGDREISRETAARIGAALGTSAELWLNLQDTYFLWEQAGDSEAQARLNAVRHRARLRDRADAQRTQ